MVRRYGLSLVAVGLTGAGSVVLARVGGSVMPLVPLFAVVVAILVVGGMGPGILAASVASVFAGAAQYWPNHDFHGDDLLRLIIFVLACAFVCRMLVPAKEHAQGEVDSLGMAVGSAVDGIAKLTDDAVFLAINPGFAATLGHSTDGLVRRPLMDVVYPLDRSAVNEALRCSREKGRAEIEARLLWRGGSAVSANMVFVRHGALGGAQRGHYLFIRDISQRKKEEEQLRESRERFQAAFRHSLVGMAVVGMDGRLLEVNPAMCVLTGYTENELLSQDFQSLTHPEDLQADLAMRRRLRDGEVDHGEMTKRYLSRDGEAFLVRVSVAIVRDPRGRALYYVIQALRKDAADALAGAGQVGGEPDPATP